MPVARAPPTRKELARMKIIHGSLSALLVEVKEQGKVDGVRIAALMQSTMEGTGVPRYTSWVIVSRARGLGKVGGVAARRGAAAGGGDRAGVPRPRQARRADRGEVAEVRGWIEAAGLAMRDGILAGDAESLEGILG